ncbi:hypothetical protein CK203_027333 [Vitis vinifera]|uniref:Uncharacterized protein n=1 Tax=Vitis vinifera TaxID=29760 RepID=A0A438J9M5_VITVI|nr:hypothetical protein CK203_027333 [Vitis vinifera]
MWKRQYISKGGRLTLIWSTLASLSIYIMSVLTLPRKIRLRQKKRGLGVKCLSSCNKALLCKWSWKFANERKALWNQVIRGKYGKEQGIGAPRK